MARVVVAEDALRDLERIQETHDLPATTEARFVRGLERLELFPESGARLLGRYAGRRFVLGPWHWMIIVYRFQPEQDLVSVLRVFDGRSGESPTST